MRRLLIAATAVRPELGGRNTKALEEILEGVLALVAFASLGDVLGALGHLDVDDRRAVALDKGRKIRQRETLGGGGGNRGGILCGGGGGGLGIRIADARRQRDGH